MKLMYKVTEFSILGVYGIIAIFLLGSCKEDQTVPPNEDLRASATWTIEGYTNPWSFSAALWATQNEYGINFGCDANPTSCLSFYMDSGVPKEYINKDPNGPWIITAIPRRFYMYQSNKSAKEFNLDPSVMNMETGEIRIGIDTFNLVSERGTMHIEKCENNMNQYVLSYDSKGNFDGLFYDEKRPAIKYQIKGSWDINL